MASFFIPNEHIHFKPLKSEVHIACDDEVENIANTKEIRSKHFRQPLPGQFP